jgi:DNA-binding CsgD family transcriptional regulator
MSYDVLTLLSETQRDYLQLVAGGMTSKQIALLRGGSHHTVNVEIARAVRIVGAKNRVEASLRIIELERSPKPVATTDFPAAAPQSASYDISYEPSYEPEPIVQPAQVDISQTSEAPGERHFFLPVSTRANPQNTLTFWQRTVWVLILAMAIAMALGGLVSGITALLDGLGRMV